MKNPTFDEFVDEMFMMIFNALITGGTKEMKSRVHYTIDMTAQIMASGGFSKEGE